MTGSRRLLGRGRRRWLDLAPDDWACEPKMDGVRVVIARPRRHGPTHVWTRQGTPLSPGKGAACLGRLFDGVVLTGHACFVEGEWVNGGILYLFDLPNHPGTYDERHFALLKLLRRIERPGFELIDRAETGFYEAHRGTAEGVVMKRRASLYPKCHQPNTPTRDWLKRRYCWD